MYKRSVIGLFVALVGLSGCQSGGTTPIASITASETSGLGPLSVQFFAQVSQGDGELTFSWDFGDGETSTDPNPRHTFQAAETSWSVTLEVTDEDGDTGSSGISIEVDEDVAPTASASADVTSGAAPLAVTFSCTVSGGNGTSSVQWDFGDGTASTATSATHTYLAPGTYRASCTATDTDGDAETSDAVEIVVRPDAVPQVSATATPREGQVPVEVSFAAAAVGGDGTPTYHWDFGDGESDEVASTTHTYTTAGAYIATATATDEDGDQDSTSVSLAFTGPDVTPTAEASADVSSGLAPLAVAFTCEATGGNPPVAIAWSFGDGATGSGAATAHTYVAPGSYTAWCTVTDGDGDPASDDVPITVIADTAPSVSISAAPGSGQAPLDVSFVGVATGGNGDLDYAWAFGDGDTASTATADHEYTASGTYAAVLTVTDEDDDVGTATFTVHVTPTDSDPVVVASVAAGACAIPGDTLVQLDASESEDPEEVPVTFQWTFVTRPAGSTAALNDPTVANPSFVPDEAGTYTLRVFVSDGTNTAASDLLTVVAGGASVIEVVGGDAQTGTTGELLEEPLWAEVANVCDLPVRGARVRWYSLDGTITPAITTAGWNGQTHAYARLGPDEGAQSFVAALDSGAEATFTATAEAGLPELLLAEYAEIAVGTPGDLTLTITDAYGNPAPFGAATFDLSIASGLVGEAGEAWFGDCETGTKALTGVSTTDGAVTVSVCSNTVGRLLVDVDDLSVNLAVRGKVTLLTDDFEGPRETYPNPGRYWSASPPPGAENAFERGVPTYPTDLTPPSGVQVEGTNLAGPVGFREPYPGLSYELIYLTMNAPLDPELELVALDLSYESWLDLSDLSPNVACPSLVIPDWTYFDGDEVRTDGIPVNGCIGVDGYQRAGAGWSRWHLTRRAAPPKSDLFLGWFVVLSPDATGAGWYLDDLAVEGLNTQPVVDFIAGPAEQVLLERVSLSEVTTCEAHEVKGTLADAEGNERDDTGVSVTFEGTPGSASFAPSVGTDFTGDNPATLASVDGTVAVKVTETTAGSVTVTANVVGEVTTNDLSLDFVEPAGSETACGDGRDDDCDLAIDCDDSECSGDDLCLEESDCLDGVDNDEDGLTDCEEPQCRSQAICQVGLAETCDGTDDAIVLDLLPNYVDELACYCDPGGGNTGCDTLTDPYGEPYVCSEEVAASLAIEGAICAPNCAFTDDYCADIGLACDSGSGQCVVPCAEDSTCCCQAYTVYYQYIPSPPYYYYYYEYYDCVPYYQGCSCIDWGPYPGYYDAYYSGNWQCSRGD
ncbi:MAG: PKD domain-containing protein [Deltaproteobacteria bacterium]|nr:PKD domain-containing protein [Deltaproteobacteria bacterium]